MRVAQNKARRRATTTRYLPIYWWVPERLTLHVQRFFLAYLIQLGAGAVQWPRASTLKLTFCQGVAS